MVKIKKLGIIGGMGPLATSLFLKRIIENTCAEKDQDHIDIIVSNHSTLPDRTKIIQEEKPELFLTRIKEDIDLMEYAKVDNIAIPCNTSHYFYEDMQNMTYINIINMVEETIKYVKNNLDFKKIAVLGTYGTMNYGIYDEYANKYGFEVYKLNNEEEKIIVNTIYNVKEKMILYSESFNELISQLSKKDIISIIACTELSIVEILKELNSYYIDAMDILVRKSIEYSDKQIKSQKLYE